MSLGTKLNSPNILSATFLVRYLQNIISELSAEPFGMPVPKRPSSGMKIQEDGTGLFSSSGNGQNLVQ